MNVFSNRHERQTSQSDHRQCFCWEGEREKHVFVMMFRFGIWFVEMRGLQFRDFKSAREPCRAHRKT